MITAYLGTFDSVALKGVQHVEFNNKDFKIQLKAQVIVFV